MILWGNISHFSVFMILQLLASYGKSGILELEDDEEKSLLYLKDGCVEAVSVPRSDHKLGARLVKRGVISQADLSRLLMSAAMLEKPEFLGITLMKSGMIDAEAMVEVLREQAYENTLELSNWVQGTFRFLSPATPVVFPVSPEINVQHLLLETSRRLDEGQRPSKAKAELPGHDLCCSCSAGCNAVQKNKYLKDGICLWRNMPVVVRESLFSNENTPVFHDYSTEEDEEAHARDLPFL